MTDTAESVRMLATSYMLDANHDVFLRYATLLERIEKAPRAIVSMVASGEEAGKPDAVTAGTYLHGENEALHGMIGKRVALVEVHE